MNGEKIILIACDETAALTAIWNSIKGAVHFPHQIITATRTADAKQVIKSISIDLIVWCFRNNQLIVNELGELFKNYQIPGICLTRKFECDNLKWDKDQVVFTCLYEHISNSRFLATTINSVFQLKTGVQKVKQPETLAEAALRQNSFGINDNLSRYVMELDQKAELLQKVKERIADLYPRVDHPVRMELTSIVNTIKSSVRDSKLWDDFKLYFEQTNPNFLLKLANKYPELTTVDLKYCCYLKMNMTNDDIRNLLGINPESVRTHKYRLKRKMALTKDQDLVSYLRAVS
ncbi:helix-turn-helix transcriptional regulator [Mucilaginibacter celer]|uniref:HTH luxR-type domain-containing protein n=1 Tax=Mucilaginibacter celer TaxID=2305508 RepID=A0A494VTU4_9SPHI|nr:hypothetical protein [Mucilaginibacter celer]AYL99027.1 hypothetical protein HYN43_028805 [Mucilaginibacter celer]